MGLLDGYWTKEEQAQLPGLLRGLFGFTAGTADNVDASVRSTLDPIGTAQGLLGSAKAIAADPGGAVRSGLLAARQRMADALQSPESAGMLASSFVTPQLVRGLLQPHMRDMTAYHGSPHDFDKFDSSKIGTGEGAQAYGHGLYFAENPGVAKSYMNIPNSVHKNLSGDWMASEISDAAKGFVRGDYSPDEMGAIAASIGRTYELPAPERDAVRAAIKELSTRKDFVDAVNAPFGTGVEWLANQRKIAQDFLGEYRQRFSPRLYTVDIPDEHVNRMLDWENQIPEETRAALSKAASAKFGSGIGKVPGGDVYNQIVWEFKNAGSSNPAADASAWFAQNGVPGIKYLDRGSRGAGTGTRNFVVFDDKLVKVLKKE